MTLANSVVNVWPKQNNTNVIAVNGSYPGPSVVIQKGDTFTAHFVNNLSEPATAHWHGISAPELMDGHPKDAIEPGNSFTYTFSHIEQSRNILLSCSCRYACPSMSIKDCRIFIVDDPAEISLGLPRGQYDVPLACRTEDWLIFLNLIIIRLLLTTRGISRKYCSGERNSGCLFEVSKTLYRFRLLNGSNARVYKIALSNNSPFKIIATDGGLKEAPAEVTSFSFHLVKELTYFVDFSSYSPGDSLILKHLLSLLPAEEFTDRELK